MNDEAHRALELETLKNIISADIPEEDPVDLSESLSHSETREWEMQVGHHGMRLDRALAQIIPEFSRSYLQQLITRGCVASQGVAWTKPSMTVKLGQKGTVELLPTPMSQAFVPQAMDLDVVFEDAHLMVINKPAGLVVHPAPGNWSGTLLNALLARDPRAADLPRAGIVHRLDKDTSGLMVVARSRAAMDTLSTMISVHDVRRQYLAIAHRSWAGRRVREVEASVGRDPKNRLRMAVVDLQRQPGKTAKTTLECLESTSDVCLMQCSLHTGRTHQIRVHMSSIGHPLVGDELYGGQAMAGMHRQALHAFRLAFAHPVSHESLQFHSKAPPDFVLAMAQLGLGYNDFN
jgi:23S rRNA pseudouridine1911/1915/1917 synthase